MKSLFSFLLFIFGCLLLSVSLAKPVCSDGYDWLESKPMSRYIEDHWIYFIKSHACVADDQTNMVRPQVLCAVDCGFTHNATSVEVRTVISDNRLNINYAEMIKLNACKNKNCFVNTCQDFFMNFKLRAHCAATYHKAFKAHEASKKQQPVSGEN